MSATDTIEAPASMPQRPQVKAPGHYWMGITLLGALLMVKVSQGPEGRRDVAAPPAPSPEAMAPAPATGVHGDPASAPHRGPGTMAFFLPGVLV